MKRSRKISVQTTAMAATVGTAAVLLAAGFAAPASAVIQGSPYVRVYNEANYVADGWLDGSQFSKTGPGGTTINTFQSFSGSQDVTLYFYIDNGKKIGTINVNLDEDATIYLYGTATAPTVTGGNS
ncbi:MAG: hypothetical protein ACRDN0_40700 [Trebonia sp.]